MPKKTTSKRPRDAVATRQAILASARRAFVQFGYDGAGLRDIAAGAGCAPMLLSHYFRNKEGLFAEVLADTVASTSVVLPQILKQPANGQRMAELLVQITQAGATPMDGFLIMMRSASSPRAAELGRRLIEQYQQDPIAEAFGGGAQAARRASVLLSLIAGFQLMRQMIGLSPLADASSEELVALLAPLFEALVR